MLAFPRVSEAAIDTYRVTLTADERANLEHLVSAGKGEARRLVKDMELETNRVFEAIVRDGIARGAFRPCRVDLVTYNIVMLGHMWALKRWYLGKVMDLETYIAEQTEFILAALRRPADGSRRRPAPPGDSWRDGRCPGGGS